MMSDASGQQQPTQLLHLWAYGVLTVAFVIAYLANPALPGNEPVHPLGWWGWWDQGHYIKSARALAIGDWNPDAHWYPMGFSLLASPFARIMPNHPFFFVGLASLLAALWLTIKIGETLGINRHVAATLFVGSLLLDRLIFIQFVIPWNTTPVTVYVYTALYLALRKQPPGLIDVCLAAACAALTLVTRPSDVAVIAPAGVALLVRVSREVPPAKALHILICGVVTASVTLGAYAALHAAIFGWAPSPYMLHSNSLGLSFNNYAAKLYAVVVDPYPIYGEGEGLLRRAPWLFWALPALVISATANWRAALIAAVIVIDIGFYSAYVDFLPHGIWRYYNIHYLKLAYPLLAMLAYYCVRICYRRLILMLPATLLVLLLLTIRVEPVERPAIAVMILNNRTLTFSCASCDNARVAVVRPSKLSYTQIYFEPNRAQIGVDSFRNIYDFRTIPVEGTIRAIFPVSFRGQMVTLELATPHGYTAEAPPQVDIVSTRLRLRWPRWL